ncbi:MAG: hypothetical protein QW133_00045 [Sulfolobales archaeon]
MNLTALGILLIIIGMVLFISAPFITIQVGEGLVTNVSGLTCVVILFIPFCFSVGMPPVITVIFALMILVVFGIFAYIAFKVYKSVLGRSQL